MSYVDNYGDLYSTYYICEECNVKVPAHGIDRHEMVTGPMNGPEQVPIIIPASTVLDGKGHELRRVHERDIPIPLDRAQRPRMRKDKPGLKSPAELRGKGRMRQLPRHA